MFCDSISFLSVLLIVPSHKIFQVAITIQNTSQQEKKHFKLIMTKQLRFSQFSKANMIPIKFYEVYEIFVTIVQSLQTFLYAYIYIFDLCLLHIYIR